MIVYDSCIIYDYICCVINFTYMKHQNSSLIVLIAVLLGLSIYGFIELKDYDGISRFPLFTCIQLFLVAICAIGYLVYNICQAKNDQENLCIIERKYTFPIVMTIASLSISVIVILSLLVSSYIKIDPNNVSQEAITNFYTAFIALCTTFVVGFQIYNSIDLNKKMEKLDNAKREVEKQLESLSAKMEELDSDKKGLQDQVHNMTELNKRCEYFNAYSIGTIRYNEAKLNEKLDPEAPKRYCWNAMRAYFNALKLAAEGGQDFEEAWRSFGETKIRKCLRILEDVHSQYDYGDGTGDDISVMPLYSTRVKIIRQINSYIDVTRQQPISSSLMNEYWELVVNWNKFLKSYYPDVK